jgi:hypothetical protein
MGVVFSGPHPSVVLPWIAAAGIGLYVSAVSLIAAHETRARRLGATRWMPSLSLVAAFAAPRLYAGSASCLHLLAAAGATAAAWDLGRRMGPKPPPGSVPPVVGAFIRVLVPVQAAFCVTVPGPGMTAAMALLCLWPAAAALGRRYNGS